MATHVPLVSKKTHYICCILALLMNEASAAKDEYGDEDLPVSIPKNQRHCSTLCQIPTKGTCGGITGTLDAVQAEGAESMQCNTQHVSQQRLHVLARRAATGSVLSRSLMCVRRRV
jgi:hypothetical protein